MHQVRRVVATPLGTQAARAWVDGVDGQTWCMRTRSGRGGHGRGRRGVGVRWDGSTGE